ncbi:uncharacterized protein LOC106355385 [Brassica napus]|uniref:uncharacterized protein LOC106355385 n=1 Tax=Brassica napus TaxID=3708 RepID=UPI0006AB2D05|nr:uncharacterized protein LOC106355385 [Brassica napus]
MGDDNTIIRTKEFTPPTIQCPILNATNYTVWSMRMKVLLKIYKVWETIEPGIEDPDKNNIAIVGEQETSKGIWDAVKARNVGADRVKEARLQTLMTEFDRIKMKDLDTIDSFSGELSEMASKSAALGKIIEENVLCQEKEKKDRSMIVCFRCDKNGHFASVCPERLQKIQESNKVETEEADPALYMHEIVFLNEENLVPKKYEIKQGEEDVWYLDNGASNHMTGNVSYFSELNRNIKGKVKFGDDSYVNIEGKGSIIFQGKTGEQKLVTNIYYIPDLKSNILSLGQATEVGCDVRMKLDYLTVHDPSGRLLVRVFRSPNRLYKIKLKIGKPMCLNIKLEDRNVEVACKVRTCEF